jgi:conjugal transfer pilus assembly protein TraB
MDLSSDPNRNSNDVDAKSAYNCDNQTESSKSSNCRPSGMTPSTGPGIIPGGSSSMLVRKQQYKTFAMILGGIVAVFVVVMLVRESGKNKNTTSGAHYKKEFNTGVDGLTEKELWVEKSTNELDELKRQNETLQKQLDSVQKIVIGLGRHLRAFDDQQPDDTTDTISSKEVPGYEKYKNEHSTELNSSSGASLNSLENFVEGGMQSGGMSSEGFTTADENNSKILKGGIKTITFSHTESEHDLDQNFIFATTYARCVLVGSVTVSAGIGASSNPQPVVLRITDTGNLPNNVKGFLKDAMVLGAAYGELSSESVVIRLERIVKIDQKHGIGMDIPVKGYVAGENGDSRIRGLVFDRAGAAVRGAAVAGFFSGMADFMSANNNSAVTFAPNSGLAQFSPQKGSKMLEQGASKGIGNAVEKYADFVIKRAEQMQPVIKIDGGRKLTIVFTESVKASAVHMKKIRRQLCEKSAGANAFGTAK